LTRDIVNTPRTRKVRSYPLHPIQDCLEIPKTIYNNNSGLPIDRIILSSQLKSTPSSSGFITKLNSSAKYGLTIGGYKDPEISLTSLGLSVISPKTDNELRLSLIKCVLNSDVFRRFYEILDGKPVPPPENSKNLIYRDFNIDNSLLDECFNLIIENGRYTNIITQVGHEMIINLKPYIDSLSDTQVGNKTVSFQNEPISDIDLGPSNCLGLIGHVGMFDVANSLSSLFSKLALNSTVEDLFFSNNSELDKILTESIKNRKFLVLLLSSLGQDSSPTEKIFQSEKISTILGVLSVIFRNRLILIDDFGLSSDSIPPGVQVLNYDRFDSQDSLFLEIIEILIKTQVIQVNVIE
tara:strand:- start:26826 stop:27881 length:1056 start_codon:yes stop_codon:yes gene_type:complete